MHGHLIQAGQVDVPQVQADQLWVKLVDKKVWMAVALAVPSHLWLTGVISPQHDPTLITRLIQIVRSYAVSPAILGCMHAIIPLLYELTRPTLVTCDDCALTHARCWT